MSWVAALIVALACGMAVSIAAQAIVWFLDRKEG